MRRRQGAREEIGPLGIFRHANGGGLTLVWKSDNEPPPWPAAPADEVENFGVVARSTGVLAIGGVVLTVIVAGAGIRLLAAMSWIWGTLAVAAACLLALITVILLMIRVFGSKWRPDRTVLLSKDEAEDFLAAVDGERARIDAAATGQDTVTVEAARRLWSIATAREGSG
jgi:hypothetical protein